jgi:hypothetical protein
MSFGAFGDHYRKKNPLPPSARSDISPMGFGQEEAGGAHVRIQEELLKVSVARIEEEAAAKKKAAEEEVAARAKVIEAIQEEAEARKIMSDQFSGKFYSDQFRNAGRWIARQFE